MSKKIVYFDNCSDSFPKAPNIYKKSAKFMETFGIYPHLGNSFLHKESYDIIKITKIKLSNIFNISNPKNIFFSNSTNEIMHFFINNFLKKGDHIITSNFENDNLLEVLYNLEKNGIQISYIKPDNSGNIDPLHFLWAIRETTKLIYCSHVSSLNSSLLPINELGRIAKTHNIPFFVDVSKSAGLIDLDVEESYISCLVSNVNNYLLGPQSLAFSYINKENFNEAFFNKISSFFIQHNINLYGISALYYALEFYEERDRKRDLDKLYKIQEYILLEFQNEKNIKVNFPIRESIPEILFSLISLDSVSFYDFLISNNIILGTTERQIGHKEDIQLKISLGIFNTIEEAKYLIKIIRLYIKETFLTLNKNK